MSHCENIERIKALIVANQFDQDLIIEIPLVNFDPWSPHGTRETVQVSAIDLIFEVTVHIDVHNNTMDLATEVKCQNVVLPFHRQWRLEIRYSNNEERVFLDSQSFHDNHYGHRNSISREVYDLSIRHMPRHENVPFSTQIVIELPRINYLDIIKVINFTKDDLVQRIQGVLGTN